jgi:hypothetical protein
MENFLNLFYRNTMDTLHDKDKTEQGPIGNTTGEETKTTTSV